MLFKSLLLALLVIINFSVFFSAVYIQNSEEVEDFLDSSIDSLQNFVPLSDFSNNVLQSDEEQSLFNQVQATEDLDKAQYYAQKYSPYIYIHSDEKYFPVKVENALDWWKISDSQLADSNTVLELKNKGETWNPNAPVYANLRFPNDNEIWITYAIVQLYNGCGPKIGITATIAGEGIKNQAQTVCPAGVHNGDFEHMTVVVNKNTGGLTKIYVAYHSWGSWHNIYTNNIYTNGVGIKFEGSHPVLYMAKGSHALYGSIKAFGQELFLPSRSYKQLWKEKQSVNIPCPKMCSVGGIDIPCGTTTCDIGYETSGYLIDYLAKGNLWKPPVRVIAHEGKPVSSITPAERNVSLFKGRFGLKIENNGFDNLKQSVLDITWGLRQVCSSCDSKIRSGLSAAEGELKSDGPTGLGAKGWWGGNTDP